MRARLTKSRRLVVKVGSALVTNNGAGLALDAIAEWARQMAVLLAEGRQVSGWAGANDHMPCTSYRQRQPLARWGWHKPTKPISPGMA